MSDRLIIVRVLGLGSLLTDAQLVLTSRGTLPYLDAVATLQGVVADLGDQYSSEIGFFDSMGSDPTTSFSVISTAETRAALLGRAKVPVYDGANAPVVTTTYVPPLFTGVTIGVSDTAAMYVGQRIRIGTIAWEVTNVVGSNEIRAKRIWGSPRTPIPMILAGEEAVGMVVYDLLLSTGNVEGLPIVISTAEVTATSRAQEEVIYRGQITKVGVDTSNHAANQISVQCGSLMGYLKAAPFRPPVGQSAVLTLPTYLLDPDTFRARQDYLTPTQLVLTVNSGVYGVPTADGGGVRTATSMRAFQVRDGGRGSALGYSTDETGIWPFIQSVNGYATRLNYMMPVAYAGHEPAGVAFLWVFDTSFFTSNGQSAITESMANFEPEHTWSRGDVTATVEGGWVCAGDVAPAVMLFDLLFGSVDGNESGVLGWRSATEAAWLPYSEDETADDVVDWASLQALLQGRDDVFPGANPNLNLRPLPYDASAAKTVADVLGLILKRLGGFAVFDRGKLRFGSWAVNNPVPTVVTDAALAEPNIAMDFDRSACLQAVEVEAGVYRWRNDQSADTNRSIKRPVTNLDLGAAGLGKTAQMGCFISKNEGATWVENWILGSTWFATANQAIVRYSQPAARVTVTYRDVVADLTVGETVAFSTAFLPSATGAMGVELAVGIVLKAARSWRTPTTEYTLLLFGYTQATAAKVPLIAVAARATGPAIVGDKIPIEPVWFTRGATATGGAPTSDAEAWVQAATLAGTATVRAILCDSHGTEIGGGVDYCYGDPVTNTLRFPGGPPFGGATITAGDVVILAWSAAGWDAFQADGAGELDGSAATAFRWVQ